MSVSGVLPFPCSAFRLGCMPFGVLFTSLLLLLSPLTIEGSPEKAPPKRPSERFTVYVDPDPQATISTTSIDKILQSVAKRIGKRKNWLLVTDNPDKAEVFVRVLSHRVRQEHISTLETRVRFQPRSDGGGPPIDYVDSNYVSDTHYLEARVRALGLGRLVVGHDGRRRGASLDRAASALAEELEGFLKANYWDLEQRRKNRAAEGIELPPIGESLSNDNAAGDQRAVDPRFAGYLRSIARYRSGEFVPAALSISRLTPEELYNMGTLFLAGDRTDSELKTAALLHTECIVSLPRQEVSPMELARRTAQHLQLAKRYAEVLSDVSERRAFQKRWHLVSVYYFYRDLRSTESESLLASGLQLFPDDQELLFALGAFREASGTLGADRDALNEAERIYKYLAETEADVQDLDVRLAHVLLRLGRTNEAEHILRVANDDDGDKLTVWMLRGYLAATQGRWNDASDAFAKAVERDPVCQACVVALASAFERSGRREAAARVVADWLATPTVSTRDGWWRFLLGPASQFETILAELRSEVAAE